MTGTTVVKLGGSLLEDPARRAAALDAIAALSRNKGPAAGAAPIVLVHGGGKDVDRWLARLGLERRTHRGLRITDEPTLEVVVSVLAGLVNKRLVAELASRGVPAFGLSGADAGLLSAARMEPDGPVDFGRVGRVTRCDPGPISALLAAGYLPVVASVALGPGPGPDLLNVNADAVASALAAALAAPRLVFLTDVEGLLDLRGRRMPRLNAARVRSLLQNPAAVTGGMRPKLDACLRALEGGVRHIVIAGPRHQVRALRRGEGGTRLVAA